MRQKKSNFRGKVSKDAKRQQSAGSTYGYLSLPKNVKVFSPETKGSMKFDIMPYLVTDPKHPDKNVELDIATPDTLWFKRPYIIHRNVGADNDSVVCLASIGKKCPICEYRIKRIKEGAEKEELDALKQSKRNLYCIIPVGSKKYESVPHIFDMSQFLFQDLLNEELEENEENEVFPDLAEGKTLKVRFESKVIGKSQPFAMASRIDFEEREEQYDESILDEIPNLDKLLVIMSYDELYNKFFELENEEEEESLRPVSKREKEKAAPVKRKAVPVDEDDDEDEEDDDEDGTPAPSSKKLHCPYGYEFGKDHDEYAECDDCAFNAKCARAQ